MTPVPLDLPLRPSEAGQIAGLIFDSAERKPLTADLRNRLTARAAALRLETIVPYFGSLERDPVHHSTYYLAVDALPAMSFLLHMALATAPTSSVFQKPLLVGRMRRVSGPEIVINAIPFGPADSDAVDRFAGRIEKAFLPRPQGSRTTIVAAAQDAGIFASFRAIWKKTGRNVAGIGVDSGDPYPPAYSAGIWAAIRDGWRDGFTAVARITHLSQIQDAAPFSTFAVDPAGLISSEQDPASRFQAALPFLERAHHQIRQARSALGINRPFDLELALDRTPSPTAPAELAFCLEWLKNRGHAVQLVAPNFQGAAESQVRELADLCRHHQCALDVPAASDSLLEAANRATGGRITCSLWGQHRGPEAVDRVAESLFR